MSEYTLMRNKGKYTFESNVREIDFEKKKSFGWINEYKSYRENWLVYPEQRTVSKYPLNVDIELTTLCNLKCPMCFTVTEGYDKFRKQEFMSFEMFKKIIDEIVGNVPAIRFSSSGEQTLHPEFLKCVAYAKKAGIKEISMVTNGSKLTEAFLGELVEYVDWIIISVDGMDEEYERVRYPMKFQQIITSLKTLQQIKETKHIDKPVVQIQSVWTSIEGCYEEYYKLFKPITDLIQFGILIDYENEKNLIYEEDFCCSAIYQRMEVGFDGKVYPCCANNGIRLSVGNVNDQSLYAIWHGEKMQTIRKTHENNEFKNIAMCRDCFLSRKLCVKKTNKIEDREFEVKEYVYKK